MFVPEYTEKRASLLNKMSFPNLELPLNLKILWIDAAGKSHLNSNIRKHPHEHSFFEIHFILSGTIEYICNTHVFKLSSGQAVFLPPHTRHHYHPSNDALKITIAFDADETALDTLQLRNTHALCTDYSPKIADCLSFILRHSEFSDIFTPQLIAGRVLEILYSFFYVLKIKIPKSSNPTCDPRFLVAKLFIENNIHKIITCGDIAKECCLSTRQLSRIFKTETGKSLSEYIIAVKIKHAKRLLLDTPHSIKEIGFLLGFENESSFVSFFKRHCEIPPGTFRLNLSKK